MEVSALQQMLSRFRQLQDDLQRQVNSVTVEASAGGGMVTVKMDGHKNVTGVKIDPEVAGDVEMLQDLVLAACNEATKKVDEETQRKTASLLGGLGLPPGLL
jgi:nucleoid-associated protein EbfC